MQRATRRWRRINNSLRIRRVAQYRSTSPTRTLYLSTSPSALLLLSLARSLSISRNKSSSLCLKCLLNPCRLHVPFPIIPLHMLLLLLSCCPVAFHSVSFHASAFLPPVPLSFCQLGKYLHNVVVGLADGLPQRSLISRLASPRLLHAVYTGIYIAIYTDICARIYIYSYSACICLAMSCCRGSCCFL